MTHKKKKYKKFTFVVIKKKKNPFPLEGSISTETKDSRRKDYLADNMKSTFS